MSFIHLEDNGTIRLNPDSKTFPSVQALSDKLKKKEFERVLKWIYHVYKAEHSFANLSWEERKERVANMFFDGMSCEEYVTDPIVQKVVDDYTACEYTPKARAYENVKNDLKALVDHISKIPFTRKEKVSGFVSVDVEENGNKVTKRIEITSPMEIDNSTEKLKAIESLNKLLQLEDSIRKTVEQEKIKSGMTKYKSMNVSGEFGE